MRDAEDRLRPPGLTEPGTEEFGEPFVDASEHDLFEQCHDVGESRREQSEHELADGRAHFDPVMQ